MTILNPTNEQLRKLRGITYLFRNLINGKCYVGKTKLRFMDRYNGCKWWIRTTNNYLKNAVNFYGIENFQVIILDFGIDDNQEILRLESLYIKEYNSLFPNGYNFMTESNEIKLFSEEMRMNISLAGCKGKVYKIKEIQTGQIKEFRCPKEIIDEYGIKGQNLHELLNGKLRVIKGICLPETNPEQWFHTDTLKIVVDQYGKEYKFYNTSKFERENNCSQNRVLQVINRKTNSTLSKDGRIFRLPECKDNYQFISNPNQKYQLIVLTRISDNKDFEIIPNEIEKFCNENPISKRSIYALTSGEQKTAKGFKLNKVIYL